MTKYHKKCKECEELVAKAKKQSNIANLSRPIFKNTEKILKSEN